MDNSQYIADISNAMADFLRKYVHSSVRKAAADDILTLIQLAEKEGAEFGLRLADQQIKSIIKSN